MSPARTAEQRERHRRALVGTVVAALLAVAGWVAGTAHTGALPWSGGTVVRAAFADVGTTGTSTEVRTNARRVGQVTAVEVGADGVALVTMRLDGDVPVYADASAALWDQSALGQKFVELRPGTPAAGPLGDVVIPVGRTESAHDLADLLDVFDPATRAALRTALREAGAGTGGHGPDVQAFADTAPELLTGTGAVASALASPEADLAATLGSAARLGERFTGRTEQITSLLRRAEQTLAAVSVDGGAPLGDTLAAAPPVLDHAEAAFDALPAPLADTAAAMTQLQGGAAALGQATPDLRGVLREAPLGRVPDVADAAVPALEDLTGTLADLRPLVPRAAEALDSAAEPLSVLAPYAGDIATFSGDFSRLIDSHDGFAHSFRLFFAAPGAPSLAGLGSAPTNPYPAPGEAAQDRDPDGALVPGRAGR